MASEELALGQKYFADNIKEYIFASSFEISREICRRNNPSSNQSTAVKAFTGALYPDPSEYSDQFLDISTAADVFVVQPLIIDL